MERPLGPSFCNLSPRYPSGGGAAPPFLGSRAPWQRRRVGGAADQLPGSSPPGLPNRFCASLGENDCTQQADSSQGGAGLGLHTPSWGLTCSCLCRDLPHPPPPFPVLGLLQKPGQAAQPAGTLITVSFGGGAVLLSARIVREVAVWAGPQHPVDCGLSS